MTIDELKDKLKKVTEEIFVLGDRFLYMDIYQLLIPPLLKERQEKLLRESRCLRIAIALRECKLQSEICKSENLNTIEFLALRELAVDRGYING